MAFEYWFHCDDIGISKASVASIWPLYQSGLLQGASLFVNGSGTDDFLSRLSIYRKESLRLSAHLTLTNGPSTLPKTQIPFLVDDNGVFCHGFLWLFMVNFYHPKKREIRRQVRSELLAQFKKFQSNVIYHQLSNSNLGFDGHNHIHNIPMVFHILQQDFPKIRTRTAFEPLHFSSRLQDYLKFRFLSNCLKYALLQTLNFWNYRGRTTKRACIGILFSGIQTTDTICAGIQKSKELALEELEVIVHVVKLNKDDHDGDVFGKDLLRFLRSPMRSAEADSLISSFQK